MSRSVSPLGVSVLALLHERPMHPYEMYQLLLARAQDRLVKVRPGSLYHTVARLLHTGCVQAIGVEREGNRPERTTYEITDVGRSALTATVAEMLSTPEEEYPQLPFAIAEAHNLPRDTVVQLLHRRIAQLRSDREFYREGQAMTRQREVDRKYWLDMPYQIAILDAKIDWIDGLIRELESGELEW